MPRLLHRFLQWMNPSREGLLSDSYYIIPNVKLFGAFILAGCVIEGTFLIVNIVMKLSLVIPVVHMALFIATYVYLKKTSNYFISANFFTFLGLSIIIANIVMYGGIYSTTIAWMPLFCVLAFYLLGRNAGLVWSIFGIITCIGSALVTTRFHLYSFILRGDQYFQVILVNCILISGGVTAISIAFIKSRDQVLQKVIEEKDQVKSLLDDKRLLVSTICHDIANPLAAIQGYTTLAKMSLKIEPHAKALDELQDNLFYIGASCEMLNEVISRVRDMQAYELGKKKFTMVPVPLMDIVQELRLIFENQFKAKEISFLVSSGDVHVMADKGVLLNHVFGNIISNAIKFSERGSAISLGAKSENGFVRIEVSDRGIGIPDELIPVLFSDSVNTSRLGTSGEKGTGLGLPLAKKYIEMFGGSIEILSVTDPSQPGRKGTVVGIMLQSPMIGKAAV